MEYRDFTHCKIASIVSFAITFDCEGARRLFLERFGKEPLPVRTFVTSFLKILTVMPPKPVGGHGNRRLSTEKKEVLTAFRYDPIHFVSTHFALIYLFIL